MVNRLIAEALRPYPADLVLTTKLGARLAGGGMAYAYRPGELREGNDRDRTVLGLDTVPLTHLRWGGAEDTYGEVTFDDAFDTMLAMRTEGRIDHIGLSNVTLDQLRGRTRAPPSRACRTCSATQAKGTCPPAPRGATPSQAQLAWLLACSPITVVIAGTSSVKHLEENIAAGAIGNR